MHSTRKVEAKEKHSRQPDFISALKNLDLMLGNFPRNESENFPEDSEIEVSSESYELHKKPNPVGKGWCSFNNGVLRSVVVAVWALDKTLCCFKQAGNSPVQGSEEF